MKKYQRRYVLQALKEANIPLHEREEFVDLLKEFNVKKMRGNNIRELFEILKKREEKERIEAVKFIKAEFHTHEMDTRQIIKTLKIFEVMSSEQCLRLMEFYKKINTLCPKVVYKISRRSSLEELFANLNGNGSSEEEMAKTSLDHTLSLLEKLKGVDMEEREKLVTAVEREKRIFSGTEIFAILYRVLTDGGKKVKRGGW